MDVATLQYVHSHMQTLVWLPIFFVFTCVLPWSFEGYYIVLYFFMMLKKTRSSNFALIGYCKHRFMKYLFIETPWSLYNHIAEMPVTVIKKEA